MMNLNNKVPILDELFGHLNEQVLINKIDVQIEKAIRLYSSTESVNCTSEEFRQIIASIYRRIYEQDTLNSTIYNESEALIQAIWILEKYYKGYETTGYDGALYDTTKNSSDGLQIVLERFIEIIKTIERKKYITQTFNSFIDPSDWNLRYEITIELLNRFDRYCSPELKNLEPIQLVSHLEELIINIVATTQVMRSILH